LAWLVIFGLVALTVVRFALSPPASNRDVRLVAVLMQARYLVGVAQLHLPGASPGDLHRQGKDLLDTGSFDQRLRYAIVTGELAGPRQALQHLRRLGHQRSDGTLTASEDSLELAHLLVRLYTDYEKGPENLVLSDEEQELLRGRLGWFGELALAPEGGPHPEMRERVLAAARRAALAQVGVAFIGLAGAFFGLGLLLFGLLLLYVGRLRTGLVVTGQGGIYAETFALYLVLFQAMVYASRWLPSGGDFRFALTGLVMLASLGALGWPVLRGVPWQQVRSDLGLWLGRRPALEPLAGLGCYLAALPLVLAGLLITFGLMQGQRRFGLKLDPSHPIVGVALRADVWTWVQVAILAAVLAPLVEEIMFRGALYRHLREATASRFHPALSALLSALASSLVFAAIHPQGVLGIPVLMALAVAFALAREWRDTLVPAMLAHAINNATITFMLIASTT
jgi:membrane protease YdiL (CAAX protease family)